tara:strand:- start:706 stop:921 length:216 start_codon:yes stop_codon:yes gene_type:complete
MTYVNVKATSYIDTDYLKKRVCCLTDEQVIEKSFKVKEWMDTNLDNDWVQRAGNGIIHGLNATYTFEQGVS